MKQLLIEHRMTIRLSWLSETPLVTGSLDAITLETAAKPLKDLVTDLVDEQAEGIRCDVEVTR